MARTYPDLSLIGGFLVLEVALHHDIPAEHHFADGLAVARYLAHSLGVEHGDGFLKRIRHALAPLLLRARFRRQRIPARPLGAYGGGAIDFGEPVNVRQLDADALGALQHCHRRRGAGDQADNRSCLGALGRVGRVNHGVVNDRRATHVGDAVLRDQLKDLSGTDLAQADIDAGRGGHRPGEAPAVAMEHRQRPEVYRIVCEKFG